MLILSAGYTFDAHLFSSIMFQKLSGEVASSGNFKDKPTTAMGSIFC